MSSHVGDNCAVDVKEKDVQRAPGTSMKENKNIYGGEKVVKEELYYGGEMAWLQMGRKVGTQTVVG